MMAAPMKKTTRRRAAPAEPTLREFLYTAALKSWNRISDRQFYKAQFNKVHSDGTPHGDNSERARMLDDACEHVRRAEALLKLPAGDPGYSAAPGAALDALLVAERIYGCVVGDLSADPAPAIKRAKSQGGKEAADARHKKDPFRHIWAEIRRKYNGGKGLAEYGGATAFDMAMVGDYAHVMICGKNGHERRITQGAVQKQRLRNWHKDRPK